MTAGEIVQVPTLASAIEFVRLGVRSGLIDPEMGEVMIDAAEQYHGRPEETGD